jgi:hypothetical protein
MTKVTRTHRRADRGTLIVRASITAMGLATSIGLQLIDPAPHGAADWTTPDPSGVCAANAAGSTGFL